MNAVASKLIVSVFVLLVVAESCFCAVGSPTVPPSASQGGLTPNPNSRGINAGNDIVSGNVGGGREFRGIMPYGSSSYFQGAQGAGTGSGAMESFIRRSAGSPYSSDRSPGAAQPYYSPYRSVSSLNSRGSDGYKSSSALQIPQMSPIKKPSDFGLVPLEDARKLQQKNEPMRPQTVEPAAQNSFLYGSYRPLSSTPLEMEQYISGQIRTKLNPIEQQAQSEEKRSSSLETATQTAEPKKHVFEPAAKPGQPGEPTTLSEPGLLSAQDRREIAKVPSVFDQMQKTVNDEFGKTLKKTTAELRGATEANQPSEPNTQTIMAKAIVGYSTTFATKATDRFNELMKAAEEYIKQKQYYKAADAYSLAAIYQPNNPLPYAGKSHALFGAGEYMSSAYFLSRAIEVFPDYTRFKIDLAAMFDDKDLLEKRTVDISQWQEKTGSPELQFLLAYIYLETDRLEMAQRMVNGALVNMPQSQSLQTLDKVIRLAIEETSTTRKP
jgi:tetratricopeptide (TPR) repeat protein